MAQPVSPELNSGSGAPPARTGEDEGGGTQAFHSGADSLGFGLDTPEWPGKSVWTSGTVFYSVLVATVVLTVAALIAGGSGSPAFSFGLALGVGFGAIPYLLFCAYHATATGTFGGSSQRRRKMTEDEWQHIFGPRAYSGARARASSGSAASEQDTADTSTGRKVAQADLLQAYEVLGLNIDASMKQITAAYHRLAHRYHPDKVAGQDSFSRLRAEERMKELNVAYELLRKQHARESTVPAGAAADEQSASS